MEQNNPMHKPQMYQYVNFEELLEKHSNQYGWYETVVKEAVAITREKMPGAQQLPEDVLMARAQD